MDNNTERKDYDFKQTESALKQFWQDKKVYKFKPGKKIYSIDTPPPYISGKMHIGHAFSYSQQDFMARFHRMRGEAVFYPFGTDDNGLPSERFVEKRANVRSVEMSRSEFIELCIKTIKETTPELIEDFKNMGISCDFEKYYSTIDKPTQKISQSSFIELYKKKEIYKKEFPTIWCTYCQTAIAQAELEDKEQATLFSTIKFEANGKNLLIATTRPELIPACVAIFVNPKDERYKQLIGKNARVPLQEFEVPIIADESADIEKGTGAMMVCSYGDKYDAQAIARHKLNPKIIIEKNGKINSGKYQGMFVKEARKAILEDLKEAGLITEQKQITHVVNVHDRCGNPIEVIPTSQWFTKVLDKKKELIAQGKKIKWHPEFMFKRYENWILGLEWDWNISRNRHFGVPIPVWECKKCGEIILPEEKELPVDPLAIKKMCKKCKHEAEGEKMVLDTWATSSLTPQIGASLSEKKAKIPFSLRPQAHDIIRTWAFYTIVKSYLQEKEIPWKEIMVSGFVTLGGEKMSKSKGNVISPKDILNSYGADSLRFWAAGSKLGEDLDYQEKEMVAAKKLITKMWNASKFVFMNLEGYNGEKPKKLEKIDALLLKKLNSLVKSSTEAFENYEYHRARAESEKFFWSFCDNYVEIVKARIYNETGERKISAQYALYQALLTQLKLFAPIMPFITEELFKLYFKNEKEESIHLCSWPEHEKEQKTEELDAFYEILGKIRQEKSRAQKSMKAEIILHLEKKEKESIKEILDDLKSVVSAKEIKEGSFRVEFV